MSYPFNAAIKEPIKQELDFDKLVGHLKALLSRLPDKRKGFNSSYRIQDAALSAFSVFFMQCPSFLDYQNRMQETKGHNNASSLFQVENIPSDNQIRNLLDPIEPGHLTPIFDWVFNAVTHSHHIEPYRSLNNTVLIAADGVCYHSSHAVYCDNCYKREHKKGEITYSHTAITPVIVASNNPHVISLAPEFMTPQDGHDKQDSEHAAIKRWLKQHAYKYRDLGVTFLGDDLYSCQPICEAMLQEGCHFLLTCKPDSHKTLYEWIDELAMLNKVKIVTTHRKKGKKKFTDTYRFMNQVPICDSKDALIVNWCELITTNEAGKVIYKNAFITDHLISQENVAEVVLAGRARWKIENENNNTLKTKGYNLEHNFGHGKQYLSQLLLTLNLIAFLFHTLLHLIDERYKLIRKKLSRRKNFFDDVRALTRYMFFENWNHLMRFMMKGLEIEFFDTG
jgi:hypothetical protein